MHTTFRTVLCLALTIVSLCAHADERGEALLKEVKQEALKMKTFVGKVSHTFTVTSSQLAVSIRRQSEVKIKFPNLYFSKEKMQFTINTTPSQSSAGEIWSLSNGKELFRYIKSLNQYHKTVFTTTSTNDMTNYLLLPHFLGNTLPITSANYMGQEVVEGTTYDLVDITINTEQTRLYISPERRVMRAKTKGEEREKETEEFFTEYKAGVSIPDKTFNFVPPKGATLIELPDYTSELRPINSTAPDFSLNVVEGTPFSLYGTLKEKPLVLVCFWQGHDFLLKSEMTTLQNLYQTYQKQGLVVLFHGIKLPKETVLKTMQAAGATYPIALQEDNTESSVVAKLAHPSQSAYYLIGAKGKILYRNTELFEKEVFGVIKEALSKK